MSWSIRPLTSTEVRRLLPARDPAGHKGTFGHVLSVCGSVRYQGAAVLAALGAVHMGAGLVTAAFPAAVYPAVAAKLTVTPLLPLAGNGEGTLCPAALPALREALPGKTALLLGCGLGRSGDTREVTAALLEECPCPMVLDADALPDINDGPAHIDSLRRAAARIPLVLTPHPGEFARMTGLAPAEIAADRAGLARRFARENGVVLVLKGAGTIIAAPDRDAVFRNETGNDGLAKGGSGDLLAGMLAALLAQGMHPFAAAVCAVHLHGLAADRAAARFSRRGMTALDCMDELKRLLSEFE
ncbi:MAG: NAD(P)H-hydrate dehydratase [Oscillospiraceae bacterium]|jgi:NAD(P)H-hydrate epimerase|nr:NAD(P)H-hydrate dehydratase [Oscillospiraceae bacterium]